MDNKKRSMPEPTFNYKGTNIKKEYDPNSMKQPNQEPNKDKKDKQ